MNPVVAPPPPQDITPLTAAQGSSSALRADASRDLVAMGLLALMVAAGLGVASGLGLDYALKAMAFYAAGAWLVLRALLASDAAGRLHPHAVFGPANRITLLRMAGMALLAALLGEAFPGAPLAAASGPAWALVVSATVIAVLDAADGHLARRSGLASRFGARFDMETDAALTLVLCALVWQAGQAGVWVLVAGLMRYAFVAAALALPWMNRPLLPRKRRQTVCVIQITCLIVCLGPIVAPGLATAIAASSLLLLTASFAIDVQWLARQRKTPLKDTP